MYLFKTPWWLKKIYPDFVWKMSTKGKIIYLTFDDGPHPTITTFVLDELKKYNAQATFFCIGKNIEAHPEMYQQILNEGHTVGNHTQHHFNGWKTDDAIYINDIAEAANKIHSNLFRPPYGRIKKSQWSMISSQFSLIMWDVLSGDFDISLSKEKCYEKVIQYTVAGSIVVFHDSEKAWERLEYALPKVLAHFSQAGYSFQSIPNKEGQG
jgi:peptidoglycan-N-acetylglucosamine deacetylase